MTGKEWMREHLKTCEKQSGGIIAFSDGSTLRVCAGFDANMDETVVTCKACGARNTYRRPSRDVQ